jgi:predicted DNA-binding transcriptional regulator AlpA
MTTRKLINAGELAGMLGMNPRWVRDSISRRKGFPTAIRIGGVLRWDLDEINAWIDDHKLKPAARKPVTSTPRATKGAAQ